METRVLSFLLNQQILCFLTFRQWHKAHPFAKVYSWKIGKGAVPWALCIGREFFIVTVSFVNNMGLLQYEQRVHYKKIKKLKDLQDMVNINIMPFLTDRWNEVKRDEVQSRRWHGKWQKHTLKVLILKSLSAVTFHIQNPVFLSGCNVVLICLFQEGISLKMGEWESSEDAVFQNSCHVRETSVKARKEMKHD